MVRSGAAEPGGGRHVDGPYVEVVAVADQLATSLTLLLCYVESRHLAGCAGGLLSALCGPQARRSRRHPVDGYGPAFGGLGRRGVVFSGWLTPVRSQGRHPCQAGLGGGRVSEGGAHTQPAPRHCGHQSATGGSDTPWSYGSSSSGSTTSRPRSASSGSRSILIGSSCVGRFASGTAPSYAGRGDGVIAHLPGKPGAKTSTTRFCTDRVRAHPVGLKHRSRRRRPATTRSAAVALGEASQGLSPESCLARECARVDANHHGNLPTGPSSIRPNSRIATDWTSCEFRSAIWGTHLLRIVTPSPIKGVAPASFRDYCERHVDEFAARGAARSSLRIPHRRGTGLSDDMSLPKSCRGLILMLPHLDAKV